MSQGRQRKTPLKYVRRRFIFLGITTAVLIGIILIIALNVSPKSGETDKDIALDSGQSNDKDNKSSAGSVVASGDSDINIRAIAADTQDQSNFSGLGKGSTSSGNVKNDGKNWKTILVNSKNKMSKDIQIETVTIDGILIDKRIEESLIKMMMQAKADGINLKLISGYRSVDRQQEIYDEKMQEYIEAGRSTIKAKELTEYYIATPGESEHHTGLAVDIVTPTYETLNFGYADTAAAKWLKANAAEYGFILRYPEDKYEITGITFEPWHYRYVGPTAAKEIMSSKICLEEYLYLKANPPKESSEKGEDEVDK